MINSATALQMMTEEIAEPMTIGETVGLGLLKPKIKTWLGRRGFRTDTERSTLNRWTRGWVEYGLLIPISPTAYWVAEVTPETARRVMYAALNAATPQAYLYDPNTGKVHDESKAMVEKLLGAAGVIV